MNTLFFCALWGAIFCVCLAVKVIVPHSFQAQRHSLVKVTRTLRDLEDTLRSGTIPGNYDAFGQLDAPWGEFLSGSIQILRSAGAPLLPTLRRIRILAESQEVALLAARSGSTQAVAQATICTLLVPLVGTALGFFLPEVGDIWLGACAFAFFLCMLAGLWLVQLADSARWAGLPASKRAWVLLAQIYGERFLGYMRSGMPPDVAWQQSLKYQSTELSLRWGSSIWQSVELVTGPEKLFVEFGASVKKAIQVSLLEGYACTERIESLLDGLRQDFHAQTQRELQLLGTRALRPLFICIAPALMALVMLALFLHLV